MRYCYSTIADSSFPWTAHSEHFHLPISRMRDYRWSTPADDACIPMWEKSLLTTELLSQESRKWMSYMPLGTSTIFLSESRFTMRKYLPIILLSVKVRTQRGNGERNSEGNGDSRRVFRLYRWFGCARLEGLWWDTRRRPLLSLELTTEAL